MAVPSDELAPTCTVMQEQGLQPSTAYRAIQPFVHPECRDGAHLRLEVIPSLGCQVSGSHVRMWSSHDLMDLGSWSHGSGVGPSSQMSPCVISGSRAAHRDPMNAPHPVCCLCGPLATQLLRTCECIRSPGALMSDHGPGVLDLSCPDLMDPGSPHLAIRCPDPMDLVFGSVVARQLSGWPCLTVVHGCI